MAVLITGGHGHIASWAAHYLANQGERVILYDTQPEAPDCLSDVANQIEFVKGDVLDFPRLTDIFRQRKGEIDGIIHTVGIMGEFVQTNPHHNVTLNIAGTLNMLEIARIFEIPKVVYTSTGAVYGTVSGIVAEDTYPPNPSDLYGATKLSNEYLGQQYGKTFGIDFRIARLSFCYGAGKFPSRFIKLYKIAFGALEGLEGLQIDAGADQNIDFIYIEDAGQGIALLYQSEHLQHNIFNIATGTPNRIGSVVELAQKYSFFPVQVDIGPGELMQRCKAQDISRARAELGFEPRYTVEEGIKHYAEWLKQMLEGS